MSDVTSRRVGVHFRHRITSDVGNSSPPVDHSFTNYDLRLTFKKTGLIKLSDRRSLYDFYHLDCTPLENWYTWLRISTVLYGNISCFRSYSYFGTKIGRWVSIGTPPCPIRSLAFGPMDLTTARRAHYRWDHWLCNFRRRCTIMTSQRNSRNGYKTALNCPIQP